uniref:AlNc14C535G12082 protein n=1 Tax=Albugo laibachii Nc14 TaxID=890382 RepID=F0X0Z4_9STRA|nr:AlNc14C535G12082 [Albugo laibachii Nc14]|eukprot:CCA27440.1 AlNc14C535G12082 [Albugo laibachii Nc14]
MNAFVEFPCIHPLTDQCLLWSEIIVYNRVVEKESSFDQLIDLKWINCEKYSIVESQYCTIHSCVFKKRLSSQYQYGNIEVNCRAYRCEIAS